MVTGNERVTNGWRGTRLTAAGASIAALGAVLVGEVVHEVGEALCAFQ